MSFEDSLRDHLHREANAVPLPERRPDRAVAAAHSRRRRRQAAAGVAAVVAVAAVAAGVVPAAVGGDGDRAPDVAAGVGEALPATGPLTFDWQTGADGLYSVASSFQAADGAVYALSTGPGFVRSEADRTSAALYRLGDDGAWQPVDLEGGGRPFALDVAANGDALYAVSTGPAAGGDGSVAQLSRSADGGDTWAVEDVPPPVPPSDLTWTWDRSLSVETVGGTTIALVTTSFSLDLGASFPELEGYLAFEVDEDGIVLVRVPQPGSGEEPTAEDNAAEVAAHEAAVAGGEGPGNGILEGSRTLTWAELGLRGPDDLTAHQVLRTTGAGWEQVEVTGLPGDAVVLGTAGGRFVAQSQQPDSSVAISDDGASWTPVPLPGADAGPGGSPVVYDVASFGSALVAVESRLPAPEGSVVSQVHVSTDGGSSWQPVDLTAVGIAPDSHVDALEAGPLGVALVVRPMNGEPPVLVVSGDLVDWTVTSVADIVGADAAWNVDVTVGADRIVVTSTEQPLDEESPVGSRTAVGTLTRG